MNTDDKNVVVCFGAKHHTIDKYSPEEGCPVCFKRKITEPRTTQKKTKLENYSSGNSTLNRDHDWYQPHQ